MMLCNIYAAILHGVEDMQSNAEIVYDQTKSSAFASECKLLLNEYANVFEALVKPVAHKRDYQIDLDHPASLSPQPWLYYISEDEIKSGKQTIDEYLQKGWIMPNTSPYGALCYSNQEENGETTYTG